MVNSADSDPDSETRWTLLDFDELVEAYWDEIAPALRAEGREPKTDRPSYEWLSSNGYRSFTYALREYHDTSLSEFWNEHPDTESPGYEWGITHEPTIDALERYLDRQQQRLSWSESTIQTHRYRLARYVRAYERVNETADVLTPVARDSDIPPADAVDACWDTFDVLDRHPGTSRQTLRRIYKTVSNWYSTLVSRREAALNPTDGLDYDWSEERADGTENPPLATEHVRALYQAAKDSRERLVVVALCAWGLRSGEVAALHRRQLNLEADQPYIEFDERKNGPGTVSIIYGANVARDRIVTLQEEGSGHLFPSERSESGHRTRGTILSWFHQLAVRADLPRIDGQRPVPQMGRRFWFDRYSDTIEQLVEHQISEIAEEQGSASADVVWQDYLSEGRRRELRRRFMQEKLAAAFEGVEDSI
ncbi:Phage integrase protein [Halorhabdus tiamatea SARL4B]|uniref:Phage integrase protein n=1 Tax=Halorhabdus tiamatea SARL4B TaxID=1033806 RepID=F7PMH2_9EURY|nr:site-specific integrase [Halorhabdus tiamatea]ERJ07391.1 Phage integrase protein [Halorhabdus tiamatea SARL4B]